MDSTANGPPNRVRRSAILHVVLFAIGIVFAGRLFYLQVARHDHYQALALAEHEAKFVIPAKRGTINAHDGKDVAPLVLNENRPTLWADPRFIEDIDGTALKISEIIGGDANSYRQLLEDNSTSPYVVVAKQLTREQATGIEQAELDGVGTTDVSYRVYPEGALASQLLGFVSDDGSGQYGLEAALDTQIRGHDGLLEAITDISGVPLSSVADNVLEEAEDGDDITLTIDLNVQRHVEAALKSGVERSEGTSGSAVVMDPYTGAIIAMANYPTYDPNNFQDIEDYSVFQNNVVSGAYETGSGMKVFSMATGLNEGAVAPESTYYDAGYEQVDDRRIENADGSGGVTRTMSEVIKKSVNTGVVHVLKQLGGGEINEQARNILYEYYTQRFGFGTNTGIDQSGESSGILAEPTTGAGDNIRYANMTFGQGMTVTMLQMVAALSSIVNGGTYYQPYLVESATSGDVVHETTPKAERHSVVSASTSQQIIAMMEGVVQGGGGFSARRDSYLVGGKTGTAQIPDESGGYSLDSEIGSFLGFTGGDRPEYIIMTRVNEPKIPGYAGTVAAAPIFADISNWLIDYYKIPPR